MAEVITRLKVDSTEYDAKIKRAAQGLQHYVQSAHDSGDVIGRLLGDTRKYVESLGNMATVSTTARGRLNELTSAFTDLRTVYNSLSDEEKNAKGGFGQELNKQLEILKGRINDAKSELGDINKELGNTKESEQGAASGIQGLTSALGINLKTLTGWGTALAAGKVALDVAKDAFMANESNVDEWGRTVESAKGIYEGFLQALNNGDIGGFLNNINQITQAAREAYNALDELGTRQTILNPERAKLQTRATELRATIRREGKDSEAGKAAQAELKALEKPLTQAWRTESKLNRDAFTALVRERLAEGGINLDQKSFNRFMSTFSSDAAFQKMKSHARGSIEERQGTYIGGSMNANNMYVGGGKVDTRNTEQKLLDLFTDEWRKANSGLLTAAFSAQGSAASVLLQDARYVNDSGKGGKGGHTTTTKQEQTELQQNQKKINELTQQYVNLSAQGLQVDDERLKAIQDEIKLLEERNGKLKLYEERAHGRLLPQDISLNTDGISKHGGLGLSPKPYDEKRKGVLSDDTMAKLTKAQEKQMNAYIKQARAMGKEQKALDKIAGKSQQFVSGLSAVAQGMKGMGIELPEGIDKVIGVISSVTSVIEGVSTIVSVFTTSALTANTIALEELTAVMLATSVIPGFANGGLIGKAAGGMLIPGNSFSGDNLRMPVSSGGFIGVNSGEVILNRAQAGVIANELQGGGLHNLHLDTCITAEAIRLVLNNRGRRTGYGEYVQTNRRR